jgi:Na+-translocating ferredoxin:NAD+ oxidoreductase RnfG subunit
MAENQINNIIFKFEGDSKSAAMLELRASDIFKGTINVAAINLSDTQLNGGLILNGDAATTVNKLPIGGIFPISRYIINDNTENLYTVNFVTDTDGLVSIDLTEILKNTKFIKFYQKYSGQITLNVTIEIPKTNIYNVFVDNVKITPYFHDNITGIQFNSYNYFEQDDVITLSSIEDKITDLATLRQTYKTVEENYLLAKKQYESQVTDDVDLEIDTAESYEPKTFKTVITRLLEFQVGTLQPAIEYTNTAKLTTENERLTIIDKLVNLVAGQYPDITIEDGEGMPYNSDNTLTEAK